MARNENCKCDARFTCGYCLRNAPPYFFTTDSGVRIYETRVQHDPFVGRNAQGVEYAETPCWSLLAMPVPEVTSPEAQERARYQRLHRSAR